MKLSIIVPVYKTEKFLDKCINSILNQSFADFELLLIDDGSPDNCPAMCDNWAKTDSRIKVIHKENGGLASAVYTGIKNARGEYCGFVDSDDWINPEMFSSLISAAEKHSADIVQCGYIRIYDNHSVNFCAEKEYCYSSGKELVDHYFIEKADLFPLHPSRCSKIYKTSVLLNIADTLNHKLTMGEDLSLTLRYLNICGKVVILADNLHYCYRYTDTSMSSLYTDKKRDSVFLMISELEKLADGWGYPDLAVKAEKENQLALLIFAALMSSMPATEKTAKIKQLKAMITDSTALPRLAATEALHGRLSLMAVHYGIIYPVCAATNIFFKIRNSK